MNSRHSVVGSRNLSPLHESLTSERRSMSSGCERNWRTSYALRNRKGRTSIAGSRITSGKSPSFGNGIRSWKPRWQSRPGSANSKRRTSLKRHEDGRVFMLAETCGEEDETGLCELALPANFTRYLAEDGRRRREGRTGTDASLAFEHHAGYLPAVRSRVAAESG